MRREHPIALAVAAALGASVACAGTFTNPIVRDSADPWVFQFKGQYFHAHAGVFGLPTVDRSAKLQTVSSVAGPIVWAPPSGQPYSAELWAPELHYLDNKWHLYVAADDGNNANHRMYVLEGNSQDPQGTYDFKGKIAAATDRWAIDGTVFQHAGQKYFIWSGWPGTTNQVQNLYIASMSSPTTISGNRVQISTPEHAWEKRTGGIVPGGINEGPQVIQRDGKTFIIYSASLFADQQYCLGQLELTGTNPMLAGSWTKKTTPVFSRTSEVAGPGHASFVKSPDATQDWIVYHHHNTPAGFDERRNVSIQSFSWNADGTPNFGAPASPSFALEEPSGRAVSTFIPNCGFDRADVRASTSAGVANGVESMGNRGTVGVIDNRGRFFTPIGNGDGAQCGFINAVGDNGVFADVGPAYEAGTYSLTAGFAISSNETALATAGPANYLLVLESVGRDASGNPIESDKVTLATLNVNSSAWNSSSFSYFTANGSVPLGGNRLDSLLRVGVYSASGNLVNWSAKIDKLNLAFVPTIGWQRDAGGNWSEQRNWSGGVPSGAGAAAKFTSAISAPRTVIIDSPRTVGSILFDNASGYTLSGQALTLSNSGGAIVSVNAGTHTISAPITFAAHTTINVSPGGNILWLTGTPTYAPSVNITKTGAGNLGVRNVRADVLTITGGRVSMLGNGSPTDTSNVASVAISGGGKLDLHINDLVVRAQPIGSWNGSAYTGVIGLIQSGRNGGAWNGSGIVTSASAAAAPNVLTTLALATADQIGVAGSTWNGQLVSAGNVLVMYTYGGDANLSGGIDGDDYFQIDSNVSQSGSVFGYFNGDFNYDGSIDGDDYFIIDSNYPAQGAAPGLTPMSSVPEPAAMALLALIPLVKRPRRSVRVEFPS